MRIADHLTRIVACGEDSSDDFVEPPRLRPPNFGDAVHWGSYGSPGDRARDILSPHGLDENRCQAQYRVPSTEYRVPSHQPSAISDALEELEELKRRFS